MAIDPAKITVDVAERVHTHARGDDDQGTTEIDGEDVWWWANRTSVWFYAGPDNDGQDTIKRFETSHELHEVTR